VCTARVRAQERQHLLAERERQLADELTVGGGRSGDGVVYTF
jgi:hypothetical protein